MGPFYVSSVTLLSFSLVTYFSFWQRKKKDNLIFKQLIKIDKNIKFMAEIENEAETNYVPI